MERKLINLCFFVVFGTRIGLVFQLFLSDNVGTTFKRTKRSNSWINDQKLLFVRRCLHWECSWKMNWKNKQHIKSNNAARRFCTKIMDYKMAINHTKKRTFNPICKTMVSGLYRMHLKASRSHIWWCLKRDPIMSKKAKCESESEYSQQNITCWFSISKPNRITIQEEFWYNSVAVGFVGSEKSIISSIICKKDIWNQSVICTTSCNMNFCDDRFDDHIVINIDIFLNSFRSVQTSCVFWLRLKNWVQKDEICMMIECTNIVWQKCWTSSASSSTPKHHFSKCLSLLLNCHNKEDTINIDCNIWKSVVFSKLT